MVLVLLERDSVVGDLLPNKKGEIVFCREVSEIDAERFVLAVYYFVTGEYPVAGEPNKDYPFLESVTVEGKNKIGNSILIRSAIITRSCFPSE